MLDEDSCIVPYEEAKANAAFIAHARTMTPIACKALLTAIEALEEIQSMDLECHSENALNSITSEWPDV